MLVGACGFSPGRTASTGTGNLQVVWSVLQPNEYDTFTDNISSGNVAAPKRGLGVGAPAQTRSDVAMGTSGSMVAFRSDISLKDRIMVQPFTGQRLEMPVGFISSSLA
jgi:hypothetical protein